MFVFVSVHEMKRDSNYNCDSNYDSNCDSENEMKRDSNYNCDKMIFLYLISGWRTLLFVESKARSSSLAAITMFRVS